MSKKSKIISHKVHGGRATSGVNLVVFADGGGPIVVDGRIKVIPPWSPETHLITQAAISTSAAAEVVKDKSLKGELQNLAQRLIETR